MPQSSGSGWQGGPKTPDDDTWLHDHAQPVHDEFGGYRAVAASPRAPGGGARGRHRNFSVLAAVAVVAAAAGAGATLAMAGGSSGSPAAAPSSAPSIVAPGPTGGNGLVPGGGSVPGAGPVPGGGSVPSARPVPGGGSVAGAGPVPGGGSVASAGPVPGGGNGVAGPVPGGGGAGGVMRGLAVGKVTSVSRTSITTSGSGATFTAEVTSSTKVTGRVTSITSVKVGDTVSVQITQSGGGKAIATAIQDPASTPLSDGG